MKDLKITKEEKKEREDDMKMDSIGEEEYHYGLRIHLDKHAIEKLGLDKGMPDVGDVLEMKAKVKVVDVSVSASERGDHKSMGLQIVAADIGGEDTKEKDPAGNLYGDS